MKPIHQFLLVFIVFILAALATPGAHAQVNGLTNTGDMIVCLNSSQPYGVVATAGSTYAWSILPGTGGAGTIVAGADPGNLITVNWTSPGTCTLQVIETAGTCTGQPVTITVTVLPGMTPGTAGPDQSVCYNETPLTLSATAPVGGSGTNSYQWEFSTDGGATWETLTGANGLEYSPGQLTVTTRYHLVQTSDSGCGSVTTNDVIITVQPLITTSPIFHE